MLVALMTTLVLVGLGCGIEGSTAVAGADHRLDTGKTTMENFDLNLKLERSEPEPEQEKGVWIRVTLQNGGRQPAWVNKRLAWNGPNVPKPFREVWFRVQDADKNELPFLCKIKIRFPEAGDYLSLPAGESVSKNIRLSSCYDLKSGASYLVKAFYQDGNAEPPEPAHGAVYVKNVIESGALEVKGE